MPLYNQRAKSVRLCAVIGAGLLVLVEPVFIRAPAQAETLNQALASAYRSNPALLAQRKGVEADDESVSEARSGFRPRVIGSASAQHDATRTNPTIGASTSVSARPVGYTILLTQPVFNGFQTVNAVREAEAVVLAGRENLRAVEQTILLSAATAYMNVVRDRAIVRLQKNNVRTLAAQVRSTQGRLRVGDVSPTDVAQAQARLAEGQAEYRTALGNLQASSGRYVQEIGHTPGRLFTPKIPRQHAPATLNQAERLAMEESPTVLAAAFLERAQAHIVDRITGELLPELTVEASYDDTINPADGTDRSRNGTVLARATIPFYQGGAVYARIRQARRIREQRHREIDDARRISRGDAVAAWSGLRAAQARLRAGRLAVRANRIALDGVRAEENVGQRSLLDVLDAEQELLDANVALVITKRDITVAHFTLLQTIGRLTASDLSLTTEVHDPELHYGLVRSKPWGTRVLRDEAYEGYVIAGSLGIDDGEEAGRGLSDDVRRMSEDAAAWVTDEVHQRFN